MGVIKEREKQKADLQQKKWSRREEQDFLRTIQVFGVEFSRKESRYIWDRFKQLSRLERKYDDTLLEYYLAFMAMCKRVAGQQLSEEEGAGACGLLVQDQRGDHHTSRASGTSSGRSARPRPSRVVDTWKTRPGSSSRSSQTWFGKDGVLHS